MSPKSAIANFFTTLIVETVGAQHLQVVEIRDDFLIFGINGIAPSDVIRQIEGFMGEVQMVIDHDSPRDLTYYMSDALPAVSLIY